MFKPPVLLSCLLLVNQVSANDNPVTEIHELTLQWTGLEHQQDLLQANWRQDQPILEQQLALLERETQTLTQVLETSAQEQGEVEQKRLQLLEQQTRLEQEQSALQSSLELASRRLHALQPQLPPPLSVAWQDELPRLDDELLTASEKLQLVLELLGQLDDFQQKITVHETVMTLEDGQDYLVKQVYLGLSHGWYLSADASFAAAGMATPDGWQWTGAADAQALTQIIDIIERRQNPVLVSLPLQLKLQQAGGN